MKKMGRAHRPFYRICAMDKRSPRDGRVLEELGIYDTSVPETDARAILKKERIDYWLGVGAQPSEKVAVLIKKYGTEGTHLAAQEAALAKLSAPKVVPDPGKPASVPKQPEPEPTPEQAAAPVSEEAAPAAEEQAPEAPVAETAPAEEVAEAPAESEEKKEEPAGE